MPNISHFDIIEKIMKTIYIFNIILAINNRLYVALFKLTRGVCTGLPCSASSPKNCLVFLKRQPWVSLADGALLIGVHKSHCSFWFKSGRLLHQRKLSKTCQSEGQSWQNPVRAYTTHQSISPNGLIRLGQDLL